MPAAKAPTVVIAPKKLIEVAVPLDAINKASAREKSIRHGHPSTLHLWWARRPLAAARAVLFAQLVNDPSWKYTPDELKKPQVKSAITRKRNELFRLIEEMVPWEATGNQEILGRARKEIVASWRETCEANKAHPDAKTLFDPQKLPAFHDPFAGGGTIPLEAQRLGLEAHASDLNPVAVLINKAMIEIPRGSPAGCGHRLFHAFRAAELVAVREIACAVWIPPGAMSSQLLTRRSNWSRGRSNWSRGRSNWSEARSERG